MDEIAVMMAIVLALEATLKVVVVVLDKMMASDMKIAATEDIS